MEELIERCSLTNFHQVVDGWIIDQGPPAITGYEQFGEDPGPIFELADVSFAAIPQQAVTPQQTQSANLEVTSSDDGGQWNITQNVPLEFNLTTPYNCDIELELNIFGVGDNCECEVVVNGLTAGSFTYNSGESTQKVLVSHDYIGRDSGTGSNNLNKISVNCTSQVGGLVVNSISAKTESRPLKAHAQWFQLACGTVPAGGDSVVIAQETTTGCTTANSETETLTKSLNINASVNPAGVLKCLGLGLTAAFNESSSRSVGSTITLNEVATHKYQGTVTALADKAKTYQLYQLRVIYSSGTDDVVVNHHTYMLNDVATDQE